MHLIKEMKFLLRLFAYPLAGSSRVFAFMLPCQGVCVPVCVCLRVCVLPFCWLFCFVCHIPHTSFSTASERCFPCFLPPSAAFLFSHNFFECGWISAIFTMRPPKGGQTYLYTQPTHQAGMVKAKGNRRNVCCVCVCV